MANWYEEPTRWKRLWCWERLRAGEGETEDQMVGWHHRLNGHEFEQTLWYNRKPGMLQSMGLQNWTWLIYWTTEQHIMGDQMGNSKTGSDTQTVEWTYLSNFNVHFSRFLNVKCKYPCQRQHFNWTVLITPPFSIHCSPVHFHSVAQSCPTLWDPMNRSTPGLPVHHHLPEFTQTHVHRVHDAIQPSHPLSSPSPPALNPSQHQSLFQWVNSSHEVAKVLELQL